MSAARAASLAREPGALASRLARVDDRLNPILVKEVRQALRGRYFRNLFWTTVVLATGLGVLMILLASAQNDVDDLGQQFFATTFGVLSFAVHTFVPFWAFQSMGAEWEENTFDLLAISDLRPRQLVLGKVLAAAVQALLYYSAFSPFLVSTFLMGGVDILVIAIVIPLSVLVSTTLAFIAVAISTLGRTKIVRALLSMVLACVLLPTSIGGIGFAVMLVEQAGILRDRDFQFGLAMFVSALPLVALFAFALGCARLAHEEENRSSALRALASAITLVALGWALWAYLVLFPGEEEWLEAMPSLGLVLSFVAYLFFVTEPEPFGRRVAKQVPRSRLAALALLPWLSGGGRGIALLAGNGLVTVLTVAAAAAPNDGKCVVFCLVLYLYAFVILGLPSGLASFWVRSFAGRSAVRIAIPLLLGLAVFVPTLVGWLLDVSSWQAWEHPFNPFWVLAEIVNGKASAMSVALFQLGAVVLLTVAVNAPRVVRAVREVVRRSDERRARETAREATDAAARA